MNARPSSLWLSALACLAVMLFACGPGDDPAGDDGGSGDGATPNGTLEVTPAAAMLTVINGAAVQQAFTATLHRDDGSTEDVTASTIFTIDDPFLGTFTADVFRAGGIAGGQGIATAGYRGLFANATLTDNVQSIRVEDPAPANAPDIFGGATENPGLAPTIVYPSDTTMMPPNIGDFEVHWMDAVGSDLFEVALTSAYIDVRVYVVGVPNTGTWVSYLLDEWNIAGNSHRGESISVTVRGLNQAAPAMAGTSPAITVNLTNEDVQGGIYYWAASSTSGPGGIYRHDMANPGQAAQQFYTTAESPGNRCVACHVLSRDGTKMAITYDGGNGAASILDVATRTEQLATDGTFAWNFATFEPDGSRILTVSHGVMTLRDPNNGGVITTVPTNGYATHPDFSPGGNAIVYVESTAPTEDWYFTGGSIVIQSFDPIAGTFGAVVPLASGGGNNYYPAWSPDGQWVVFNRSAEDAYDDASAELWVVKADGSLPPLKLDSPNIASGLTNSWVRWAPFEQTFGEGENARPFFWLTFSSKRAFGVRMAANTRPQVWMAPFFPDRAELALEPSAPAFRLPMQDLTGNNHIAQWTEQVVPIE